MPLETATYTDELVTTNPASSDGMNGADDHMRLIKASIKNTIPGANGPITTAAGGHQSRTSGTAGAPAFTFADEPTLGFYRKSAGRIGIAGVLDGVVPAGFVWDFAGAAAPTGWLACDGQALSTTTYPDLFAAIGYTWGGSGSTFNAPNLLSRYRRHRDNSTLAGAVGNLQSPVNLTHSHGVYGNTGAADTDHSHYVSGSTGAMNANASHTHQSYIAGGSHSGGGGAFGFDTAAYSLTSTTATNTDHGHPFAVQSGGMSAQHAHLVNLTSGAAGDANEARPYSATMLACIKI